MIICNHILSIIIGFQMTRDDQQSSDNKWRVSLSRWATCSSLRSPYNGPIRLVLQPGIGVHLVE